MDLQDRQTSVLIAGIIPTGLVIWNIRWMSRRDRSHASAGSAAAASGQRPFATLRMIFIVILAFLPTACAAWSVSGRPCLRCALRPIARLTWIVRI